VAIAENKIFTYSKTCDEIINFDGKIRFVSVINDNWILEKIIKKILVGAS